MYCKELENLIFFVTDQLNLENENKKIIIIV